MLIDYGINSVRWDWGGISLWFEVEFIFLKECGGVCIWGLGNVVVLLYVIGVSY